MNDASTSTTPPPVQVSPTRRAKLFRIVELSAVFLGGAVLMSYLLSGRGGVNGDRIAVPGFDSFYHIEMAKLLPEMGLIDTFPWLTTTIFTDKFVSHHYGFHVFLVPFIKASQWLGSGDALQGGRWAIAFSFGAVTLLFDLLLIAGGVRYRGIWWLLFLLMPYQFFGRHVFIRAIGPSLVFMLMILLAMFRHRFVLTAILTVLYVQLYLGAVCYVPVLVGAYYAAGLLGPTCDRVSWRLPVFAAAGCLIGLAIHPYGGWDALAFLRVQVFGSGISPDIPVGREWKSYSPAWFFVRMSGVTLGVFVLAVGFRLRRGPPIDAKTLALLIVSAVFLVLTLKARRFIEYWPIFALLSSAYLVTCSAGSAKPARRRVPRLGTGALAVIGILVGSGLCLYGPLRRVRDHARCAFDLAAVESMMGYLHAHSAPHDIIFTDDWDVFGLFFYHNHRNRYVVGLDPKFTHERDPVLWKRYVAITRGRTPTTVETGTPTHKVDIHLTDIRDFFGATWVIVDEDHRSLARKLDASPDFAKCVFTTSQTAKNGTPRYAVYRVATAPSVSER